MFVIFICSRRLINIIAAFGRIDVLVNIAGTGYYDWFEESSPDNLREHDEVNVLGLADRTRKVVPVMKAQRSGFILNMCSYSSVISAPPLTVYASTKYAVEGLTDGLRRELTPWGIKVMRIHPSGVTGTEFKEKASRDGGIQFKRDSVQVDLVWPCEAVAGYELSITSPRRLPR